MALRAGALIARGSAGLLLALLFAPLAAILIRAGGGYLPAPADWAAVRFTLLQAALSALVSVALALPVARALARRRFPGRRLFIALTGAPFILPVIVAVMGLVAIFGVRGALNTALAQLGLGPLRIYGLHGVVLAHVFFNMPLATRMLLQGWQAIPAERFRLAAQLNLPPAATFRLLEVPMLRQVVPGALAAIFAICLASFAVALILGGGPRATTVELAIYQAFTFDFDLGRAAVLALMQTALVALAAVAALVFARADGSGAGLGRPIARWDAPRGWRRGADVLVLMLAAAFLAAPILSLALSGLPGLAQLPAGIWGAAMTSVLVALASAALTCLLCLGMAAGLSAVVQGVGLLPLALSPLVLGTGWFLILNPVIAPSVLALPMLVAVNTLMAMPFCLRILAPAYARAESDHGRLADQLGLRGLARLRWLVLPRLRPALGFCAGLAAALSMGDLGVITLFGTSGQDTLPLLMYRLMGAYRTEAASAVGLILMALSFGLFWLFDRGGAAPDA
ncbi:thiamine/thiamine pyrophosphate ABC transporter permease ThiP [Pseudooceanicola sp. CBS1P-1]|uniref:Thiamine/thiamine pyrophosphate ABC transporter permease ThiP n=1 Tax=Pseudooceanicola albus TaxID=2692189 RepID=A0A6L7FZF3_9RHOB|nr:MULTISPECIES: thiamine/thiamine pyrophosphate ABC transporter permease ThiP [Pseudooceanicola]MBT9383951.1 thiamine/thiamine pyrophosphate ABC transporter permease ThiP [Pseudooceanicola endophyticus]MXN16636.1 thiamine/thiamine pyrophosphate ABC transporter permease ThiP [Pseudooceanicola albus]